MNEKRLWKHIHVNLPIVFLDKFEDARKRAVACGGHDATRTAALRRAIELYIEKEGST
ncbi:hypothetical protein MUP01_10845 [Candidatus Bathyarchaeota archaeon]|nr:hypothetical protein [Candidatus Bathyarchaeota archaeon]